MKRLKPEGKPRVQIKRRDHVDLEAELDLEEYGATLGPYLKMVLKTEDLFIIAS